jgi:hypothetical protein
MKKQFLNLSGANKMSSLDVLEREAEQNFKNIVGEEDYDEDYDEDYEDYEEDYDEDYAGGQSGLSVSDRTLAIIVANGNAAGTTAVVPLFGSNANLNAASYNVPAGVTVTAPDSSYGQVLNELANDPMKIKGILMTVSNAAQFAYSLAFLKKDATGKLDSEPWQPSRYVKPENFQSTVIEAKGLTFILDGKTTLQFTSMGGVTTTFIFTIAAKVSISSILDNKSVKKSASKPRRKRRK